jgi:predicted nucleic acid-binding protein
MKSFFDTSALVPLLILELHSKGAVEAWRETEVGYAWTWARVEVEAALIRRKVAPQCWSEWRGLDSKVRWLHAPTDFIDQICQFNRALGLRAADAGQLLVFERATRAIEELKLGTFAREMHAAASRLQLSVR